MQQTSAKKAVLEKLIPLNKEQFELEDLSHQLHSLKINADSVMVDGHEVSIRVAELLYWMAKASDPTTIVTTPEALWFALAGKEVQPSAAEAGLFLAENLARWQEQRGLHQVMAGMRMAQVPPAFPLPRLDPFIEAALQRLPSDPSEEKIAALAQLVDQPVEKIISWLRQRGRLTPASFSASNDASPHEEADSPQLAMHQHSTFFASPFYWTAETEEKLTQAFWATSPEQSTSACAKDIAQRYGWPFASVNYKIRALKLPEQRAEKSTQREEAPSGGDDQEGD